MASWRSAEAAANLHVGETVASVTPELWRAELWRAELWRAELWRTAATRGSNDGECAVCAETATCQDLADLPVLSSLELGGEERLCALQLMLEDLRGPRVPN